MRKPPTGVAFDPVSLEIMWSRLINITEECWLTISRTAFSTMIGEAQDCGCELLDAKAQSIAHSPRSMPVFNLTLPRAVKALLQVFPADTLADGDVLVTNDPWVCAGHLPDLAVVTPVFSDGNLVGLMGSIAHFTDIGGSKDWGRAREIYEEGLQIPPLRLYRAGHLNDDLVAMIRANVRNPEAVFGDIQAQVGSNQVAARHLLDFMNEYRMTSLEPLAHEVQSRTETAMRAAIRALPDGTYRSDVTIQGPDGPLRLPCAVTIDGDELTVDWEGAPAQQRVGAMNCTYSYAAAHTVYVLKSILTPDIPSNAGCFRPLHVLAPQGSILNCLYPAAVNQRTLAGWFCGPAVFRSLAPVLPERVQAFTGLPIPSSAYGQDRNGRIFNDHIMFGGGQGGSQHHDGVSGLLYPTSAGNVPVEMFEQRTSLLVESKELIPDSGGAGFHRGGLGQRMRLRKLYEDGLPVLVHVLPHGKATPIAGLRGGSTGGGAGIRVEGAAVSEGGAMSNLVELSAPGGVITVETAGGSGFGDPHMRPIELIQRDIEEGYVTVDGLAAYGAEWPSGAAVPITRMKRPVSR